ncbi:MAG: hypothetical protein R3F62_26930 [Planctomycetota bacterium]
MTDDLEQRVLALGREALEDPSLELDSRWEDHGDAYPVLDLLRDAFGVELPMLEYLGPTVRDTAARVRRMLAG